MNKEIWNDVDQPVGDKLTPWHTLIGRRLVCQTKQMKWLWRRESRGRSGPSGGVNTRSHIGFCPDPEAFTDIGRAQRFIYNPVLSTVPQQRSTFMFRSFGSWCWMEDVFQENGRELKSLMSAAFSESWPEFKLSDKHPRRESSLASLRLIQSKVIRLLGTHHHCGQTCSAGGERTRH